MAIDQEVDDFIRESDTTVTGEVIKDEAPDYKPQYRMLTEDKIPISKKFGKVWKSRKDAGLGKMKANEDIERWDEAIRYYRNDHSSRSRRSDDGSVGSERSVNLTTKGLETENIVFANTSSLVPAIYAKNPTIEISVSDPAREEWATVAEKLVNTLFRKQITPGIDLKPKARRAVVMATLTNYAYIEIGYTARQESSEETVAEIQRIGKELIEAKDPKDIRRLEGELEALEEKVDFLSPSGPFAKSRRPHDVINDPDACEPSERKWMMYSEFVSTDFLRAVYGMKDEEKDQYKSIYEPTHVLRLDGASDTGIDDPHAAFTLINQEGKTKYSDYGYGDEVSYQRAQRTKVWYVWDRITRRVYLYNDNDWSWPLWVWEDPYGYPDFFPLEPLEFYVDPEDYHAKSETTYYLDQQDAINQVNNEFAKARAYISGKVVYNKRVMKDEKAIENFLAGTETKRLLGVDMDPQVDLNKVFTSFVPSSAHALQTAIFDKERLLQSIDRVSSVTNVMRGVEYKTNTTNKAIESYESNTQSRLDEKIDAIEDFIGRIGAKLLHLMVKFPDAEMVKALIGEKDAEVFINGMPAIDELSHMVSLQVVGGSTLKPTSATKKQQALQVGQVLGQFASATPTAVLVALKVLERSFDEIIVTKEDWQMIREAVQQRLQQETGAGAAGGASGGAEGGVDLDAVMSQVEQLVEQMPDQIRQQLGIAVAKGMPIKEAVMRAMQMMQSARDPQEPQSGEQ